MTPLHTVNYGAAAAGTALILGVAILVSPASPFPGRSWVTRIVYGAHWLVKLTGCFAHALDMGVSAFRDLWAATPIDLACEEKPAAKLTICDFCDLEPATGLSALKNRPICDGCREFADITRPILAEDAKAKETVQ